MNDKNFFKPLYYHHSHPGTKFPTPSFTVPDLSYSIKQLINEFAINQLPSLASLQAYFDEDEEMTGENDLRFADRAEALEKYLEASHVRRSIFDKVKSMHEFRKKEDERLLERYKKQYGDVDFSVDPKPAEKQ